MATTQKVTAWKIYYSDGLFHIEALVGSEWRVPAPSIKWRTVSYWGARLLLWRLRRQSKREHLWPSCGPSNLIYYVDEVN